MYHSQSIVFQAVCTHTLIL